MSRIFVFDDDEAQRLLRIVRRSSGSVVTWRRAQTILLSAQDMDPAKLAQVTFTSPHRLRDVIHTSTLMGSTRFTEVQGRPATDIHAAAAAVLRDVRREHDGDGAGEAEQASLLLAVSPSRSRCP